MKKWLLRLCLAMVLFAPMGEDFLNAGDKPVLTQVNIIDTLLAGMYDGTVPLGDVLRYGDYGIGTVDKLDGELIIVAGKAYHIKSDGKAYELANDITTPFVSVVNFQPGEAITVEKKSMAALCELVDSLASNQNLFVAFAVTGDFDHMHTRSVPAQTKPYKPLIEVTRNQPEFRMESVKGTLFGFRTPGYVKGINVPGYHIHFLSDDKQAGGHVLGFQMRSGELGICEIHQFTMFLPEGSEAFAEVDLNVDRGQELHEVESAKPE